jgi:hypothetical protein
VASAIEVGRMFLRDISVRRVPAAPLAVARGGAIVANAAWRLSQCSTGARCAAERRVVSRLHARIGPSRRSSAVQWSVVERCDIRGTTMAGRCGSRGVDEAMGTDELV